MKDFSYYAPTEVIFGSQSEKKTAELLKRYGAKKVLLHYGGKSAERSGLLQEVRDTLKNAGIPFVELGGVVPNPRLSMVRKGIETCRTNGLDFILAIGGGSVIDSSKAIAYGVPYSGDVWDFYTGKAVPQASLPIGTILTIPAAGSEMSDSSVITNEDGGQKKGCNNNLCRLKFAIMNPERTYTLPPYQTACGATDIMMHTMERAQIMWASSLAHNDLTGCGTTGDWATHLIEHELSGLFDVAHGAGLAAVWGSWARYVYKENVSRFVKFAVNVMGVTPDYTNPEATAIAGIEALEAFYKQIGMPTSISELLGGKQITEAEMQEMANKATGNGAYTIGQFKKLNKDDIIAIYKMAK